MEKMTITQFMTGIKNWVLGKIGAITDLIPLQASSSNKLVDLATMNSSIATATATYRGNYNVVTDLSLSYNATHAQIQTALATKMSALSIVPDNNDYAFVQIPTADATPTEISKIEKYKYNGSAWVYEYELNNSGFTAAQWAAINSGATLELIGKLSDLPTNAELTELLAAKQNVLTFDNTPTENSNNPVKSGGIYTWVMGLIATIKEWAEGLFAKMDGYYESMTVGRADNLIGEPIPVTTGYTLKATGYDPTQPELEFADGPVKMTEIAGRACAWNQLAYTNISSSNSYIVTGNTTASYSEGVLTVNLKKGSTNSFGIKTHQFVENHKILCFIDGEITCSNIKFGGRSTSGASGSTMTTEQGLNKIVTITTTTTVNGALWFFSSNDCTLIIRRIVIFDLTLLNPTLAAKANLTVAEVEAYIASIRTPKPYYARNAGTLLGARMMGWQLRKTANLLNPTTKQAKLFEYDYTGHNNEYTVTGFDGLTNAALQFTPYATGVAMSVGYAADPNPDIVIDSNNRFVIPSAGILEVIASGGDITGDISRLCVVATWDESMDGEVVAYAEDNVEVDSANIYYDNNGVKTQVFTDGIMRSTGNGASDVHDRVYFDEVAKKWKSEINVGNVDVTTFDYGLDETVVSNDWIQGTVPSDIVAEIKAIGYTIPNAIMASYSQLDDGGYNFITRHSNMQFGYRQNLSRFFLSNANFINNTKAQIKSLLNHAELWFGLVTPITHDTLYYKVGENEYLPMEQVFPDGIQGLCCNWASENLVEQAEVDGQPQSITPVTTEVFQSDMKELLKTVGDTYISKEQAKDSFDNLLSELNTNSGTALGGTYATDGFNDDGTIKFTFTANE